MINVTDILVDALRDIPYPMSEAPMKEVPSGVYLSWQPGEISRKNASGKCFEESQKADLIVIVPDGEKYQDITTSVLDALKKCRMIRYARLTDVQYLSEIQKRAISIEVLAWKEADT